MRAALPPALASARFVLLTTYRRDGTPVSTPVGPIAEDGRLYVYTPVNSGKAKRVRRSSRVQVAPCTPRGVPTAAPVEARAQLLSGTEAEEMRARFARRWGSAFGPLYGLMRLVERARGIERCVIAIAPA
ncbi:MAG TPA: PPOX class F420-dependent oxidoreductase [Candidatus Limnocylindria bacterium]|nr:PPOX class F420-dependent oxidoreductase [Candidatus Limnocylindria bacterium]